MLETTLLTGPYDWDETQLPRAEFEARIAAVRAYLHRRGLAGLIVGGTSPEHGALGYLTGFVPKLGPALAFIAAEGDPRIAFSGGAAMLSSAQRLTFITDVRAMRDPEQEVTDWLSKSAGQRFGLWGDDAITSEVRHAIDRAVPSPITVLDADLDALRRHKSHRELALIRAACDILAITLGEMRRTIICGRGARTASLAAERAGYAAAAQDVRMLMSTRPGGIPQPLIGAQDLPIDPLLVCAAVRFAGYWAEGLATIAVAPTPALAAAEAALTAMLQEIRPNVTAAQLEIAAAPALAAARLHPIVASLGNGIGLSREELPKIAPHEPLPLLEGDVCTLRMGACAGNGDSAVVSAMLRVGHNGAEVLWR